MRFCLKYQNAFQIYEEYKKRYKFNPFLGQKKKNSRLNFIVPEIFLLLENNNKLDGRLQTKANY